MLSALYYLFLVLLCTFFMILSALALVLCYPFDKGRRVVHELSRILVRIFFFIPPFWRQKVIGREYLEKLGFGNQPYLVFKHEDIDRHHLHIVTVTCFHRNLDYLTRHRRNNLILLFLITALAHTQVFSL